MSLHVNLARSWRVFDVCCSCRCQKIQIPLMFLFLLTLLTLGFPKYSASEEVYILQLFQIQPTVITWSPVDVAVRYGGGAAFYHLITSQSFNGPVSLGYDLYKGFFSRIAFSSHYLFSSLGVEFLNIPNLFPYFLETLTPVGYVLLLLFFVLFCFGVCLFFGPPPAPHCQTDSKPGRIERRGIPFHSWNKA